MCFTSGGLSARVRTCASEARSDLAVMQVAGWPALAEPAQATLQRIIDADGTVAGLKPVDIKHNNTDGSIHTTGKVTFGAYGDSYYEYLLKQYIFTGKTDAALLDAYKAAMHGVRLWLLGETAPESLGGLMYLGQADLQSLSSNATYTKGLPLKTSMEHLVCFVPGLLALGHIHGIETGAQPRGRIHL